jgi:hypothetical protein
VTKFGEWCDTYETDLSPHMLTLLSAVPHGMTYAKKVVAAAVPSYYTQPKRVAQLLSDLGKPAAAKYVAEKLPTTVAIRSGDLGEILCNAYLLEATTYKRGIRRLRWKDHRNMSMRGEDVLGFRVESDGTLHVLKAEVKSGVSMSSTTIGKARAALCANVGLPSPHALAFVADRLKEPGGDKVLANALDRATLVTRLKKSQVMHMLFTFSGNNPSTQMETNLTAYTGKIKQRYVALHVDGHQAFIKSVYKAVGK